jgi:hypothetical protein
MAPNGERKLAGAAVDLAMYALSALISFALLNNLLKKLDPNEGNAKQARPRLCEAQPRPPPSHRPCVAHRSPRRSPQAAAKKKEIADRLGRPLLNTNQYEDVRYVCAAAECEPSVQLTRSRRWLQLIACDVINPAHINVTFDSIGGLDDVKQALARSLLRPGRPPRAALTPAACRSTTWSFCRWFARSCSRAASYCGRQRRAVLAPARCARL